jgi:hypothetical protein
MTTIPTIADLQMPFDGAIFSPLTAAKRQEYNAAWLKYSAIALFQRDIAARREAGEDIVFYRFASYEERAEYLLGMKLHIQAKPTVNWCIWIPE